MGCMSSLRSLASFALSVPKWYDVALFFWVLAISVSISLIFSRIDITYFVVGVIFVVVSFEGLGFDV